MIIPQPAVFNFTLYQGSTFEEVFDFKSLYRYYYTFNAAASEVSGVDDFGNIFSYVASTDEITLCFNGEYLSKRFYTLTEPGMITYPFAIDDILQVEKRTPIVFPTITDARMTIRRSYSGAAVLALTLANGNFIITEETGRVVLKITDEETEAIINGSRFIYDMELEDVTGDVTRMAEGEIEFIRETTYDDA